MEVKTQCCYCKQPPHPEGTRISHGICDACLIKEHPEVARKKGLI